MKTHIYLVPGLAACSKIYEYLDLPKDKYELHHIEWLIPEHVNEPLVHYANRMSKLVTKKNSILIGVSFGGIMVQEMSKILQIKKIIIISSVKNSGELPKRLKITKLTKAYKYLPYKQVARNEGVVGYLFNKMSEKRSERYKQFLSVRDEVYLEWSIYNVLNWSQKETLPNVVHIHGNSDGIFPIKHIKNCIIIEGGAHVMIINKAKKVNAILIDILQENTH